MKAKFAGKCARCGAGIEVGEDCEYVAEKRQIRHWNCADARAEKDAGATTYDDANALADRLGFRKVG